MSRSVIATRALTVLPLTLLLIASACSDPEPATPQVIFDGRFEKGSTNCTEVGGAFTIGDFGNQAVEPKIPVRPVQDGASEQQGSVSISCSVTPAGNEEFNVSASVQLSGATGGLFRVTGKFKAGAENTASAVFARTARASYTQDDGKCTVVFTPPYQGVAAGRVWGEISCPNAEDKTAQVTCVGKAQFRFENCAQ
jgi:hypothetical protein